MGNKGQNAHYDWKSAGQCTHIEGKPRPRFLVRAGNVYCKLAAPKWQWRFGARALTQRSLLEWTFPLKELSATSAWHDCLSYRFRPRCRQSAESTAFLRIVCCFCAACCFLSFDTPTVIDDLYVTLEHRLAPEHRFVFATDVVRRKRWRKFRERAFVRGIQHELRGTYQRRGMSD